MASSSFTSPPFLSTPLSRTHQVSPCSKTPPPQTPTTPPSQTPQLSSNSTDWIASSLTRRFGLGAGLAWVGFLAVGVISEQVKTRLEVSQEQANTRQGFGEGRRGYTTKWHKHTRLLVIECFAWLLALHVFVDWYYDMRIGGGATPRTGDLVVIDLKGSVKDSGEVFVDTFGKNNRSLALVMGSRPYTRGMCEGIEYVLKTMKAGGKRRVIVPPKLGYCDNGADFGSDVSIPPCATLEYIVEVDRVSIAPA
uniref:peptidylprolyl isomerase n=1 Tax=Chenopodium quinoa TaxID=63459 RepID=A0A803N8A9_CHEQI